MKNYLLLIILFICSCSFDIYGQNDTVSIQREDSATTSDDNNVYTYVPEMPEFVGGKEALDKFLLENIDHTKRNKFAKTVYVGFLIKKDGSISNIRIKRSVNEELDKEAMRVIGLMANWKPGKKNGKEAIVDFVCPINFSLK